MRVEMFLRGPNGFPGRPGRDGGVIVIMFSFYSGKDDAATF